MPTTITLRAPAERRLPGGLNFPVLIPILAVVASLVLARVAAPPLERAVEEPRGAGCVLAHVPRPCELLAP
jgi:hypothetical protein